MHGVEIVYTGRDSHIELQLRENGVNLSNYAPITRVKATFGASAIDSDVNPEWLDWTGSSLVIKAGLAGLTAGKYSVKVESWDTDNSNGVVWTESLQVVVRA